MKRALRYLKAAFFLRERVPLLGHVPVNLVASAAFIALGFGHPAFWLIGLVGEIAFLWSLAGSARFRKWVDARDLAERNRASEQGEAEILASLSEERRNRYESLRTSLATIGRNRSKNADAGLAVPDDLDSYDDLLSVFLKRLEAQQRLLAPKSGDKPEEIRARAEAIHEQLGSDASLSPAARESREHTLEILRKRLEVFERKEESLDEIRSDLEQIEEQFRLALDSSDFGAGHDTTKLDLELARSMIATPSFIAFEDESGGFSARRSESE